MMVGNGQFSALAWSKSSTDSFYTYNATLWLSQRLPLFSLADLWYIEDFLFVHIYCLEILKLIYVLNNNTV